MLIVCVAVACGGGDPQADTGTDGAGADVATVDAPSRDTGRDVGDGTECTLTTFLRDCPVRDCMQPTDCADGACVYEALSCGVPGRACPVEACESTTAPDGTITNECVVVEGGACGAGGRCEGAVCVVGAEGLIGHFETNETHDETTDLRIEASMSVPQPGTAPVASGAFRLTGGFQTTSN